MPFIYKVNCLDLLKEKGYNTYRLYKEKQLPQASIQKIRNGEVLGLKGLKQLCELLELQPGDIIEYIKEKDSQ